MQKRNTVKDMGRAYGTYTDELTFNGLKPVVTILVEPTAL